MKRVFSRACMIAAPMIALAVFGQTADAATLHGAAQPKAATAVAVTARVDATPIGSLGAAVNNPVTAVSDAAGDAFGAFGVGVSKIPIIGPMITDLGEAITSLFTSVPIVGDAAQSAINTYNDNGK
jgi:hypothetical protein